MAELPQARVVLYNKHAYNKRMPRPPHARREVLFQLSDVARSMRTYIDQRAREHGMTRAQWGVLARLERREGMTQSEMAEALEIQPISLVRLVDRLCAQGLVERRPHPRDRRANRLYLTDRGRTTLVRLTPLAKEIGTELLESIGEGEIAEFLQKLLVIRANIRQASSRRLPLNGAQGDRHVR
jgi:MarR family transcriptional regulator, transcriptional regulator for hemolysin